MLTEICQYLRNWFCFDAAHSRLKSWSGTFTIVDGEIQGFNGNLIIGQYYFIVGSLLNDGVHLYPDDDLRDETFTGVIQSMAIPRAFLDLVNDISAWCENNKAKIESPYQSESFSGYSYSLKTGGDASGRGESGSNLTWQSFFAARLAPWRKI